MTTLNGQPHTQLDAFTPEQGNESLRPRNRARSLIAAGALVVGAGVVSSGCIPSNDEAIDGAQPSTLVDNDELTADTPVEHFSYDENYNPTAILAESEAIKQLAVDRLISEIVADAEIIHPYNVDGLSRQIFENSGDTPFDKASQISLFTVNDFKGTRNLGSAFLSINEPNKNIQLSTIEHTAEAGLLVNDEEFDPAAKKIMYIPGFGGVDITESFSSFLGTTDLKDSHDDVVSIDLPVFVQDALQVLAERGEIAPLAKATPEEIGLLSVGDTLEFSNIYGGGMTSNSTIMSIYDKELDMKFDLAPFGIDPSDMPDEEIAAWLEGSFKYEGQEFSPETLENSANIAYVSCGGNSGSPLIMTTENGEKKVVASHSAGQSDSSFFVRAESSNWQKDNGDDSFVAICHFNNFASLVKKIQ